MPRILITGGAGFIGGHLAHALAARGDAVTVLDDLSTGAEANLPKGAQFIFGDIRDKVAVADAIAGCDAVVHLAAIASVMRYNDDWAGASSVNLGGALNVMRTAAEASVPLVYASSAAVYGAATVLPISEAVQAAPISGYGADKLACELHARAMAETHGLRSVGLRFFNVYGPGQLRGSDYSGVITNFLDRWVAGQKLTVFGDGTQSRDFVYVGDIVRAIIAALAAVREGGSRVVNVCSGEPTSINSLVEALGQATGHGFEVQNAPRRAGEILHSLGDPTACAAFLGVRAETDLERGLAELVGWFRAGQVGAK